MDSWFRIRIWLRNSQPNLNLDLDFGQKINDIVWFWLKSMHGNQLPATRKQEISPQIRFRSRRVRQVGRTASSVPAWGHERAAKLAALLRAHQAWAGMKQTLEGSFSAASKPKFASKYAFESSRRELHNALLCTALQSQFFLKNCQTLTFC